MTYASTDRRARWLELADAEGNLERPLLADEWIAPGSSLSVRDGCLALDWGSFLQSPPRIVKAEGPMLERFARLGEPGGNPDQAVLRYARRWGLLELCQHHLSFDHESSQLPIAFAATGVEIVTFRPSAACYSLEGEEPVITWLYWSRQAAALLAILSRLRRSEPALPEDWSVLSEEAPWVAREPLAQELLEYARPWFARLVEGRVPVDVQRDVVSGAIETWLRLAGVSIELRWPDGIPEVGFRGGRLFGALGLQILLAAVDSSGWLMCPGCGSLHAPAKTRTRRRSYCEKCRANHVPQKLASARSRGKRGSDPAYREAARERARAWRMRHAAASSSPNGEEASDGSRGEVRNVKAERRR